MENKSKFKAGQKVKFPKTKTPMDYDNYEDFLSEVKESGYNKDYFIVKNNNECADNVGLMYDDSELTLNLNAFSDDDLELYEEPLSKVVVVNPIPKSKLPEFPVEGLEDSYPELYINRDLTLIKVKDFAMYEEIDRLISHLASTYGDKYEESSKYVFVPKEGLTKEVALWNTSKYLRRYSTIGFAKSEDTKDVLKAIHYLLMENKRKNGN